MKVSFLGLGVMGYPMAGHLVKAGHQVTVYNRTTSKAEAWASQFGGEFAVTPKEAAKDADIVFACVGNDDDLRSIVLGDEGAFASMNSGSVFVDHTTASAQVARELSSVAAKHSISFIDAPVSGGQAGAENGVLTIMCGGDQTAFDHAKPVMDAYAREARLLGEVGSGQLAKMVNQICIAGIVQGLSEGIYFAQKAGLNPSEVIEVISKGAAQSWQMENRYKTMIEGEYDHGFAVDWMRKDLGIVLDEADRQGATLALTALVDQFYADVQRSGGGRWDTSSLLARLQHIDAVQF